MRTNLTFRHPAEFVGDQENGGGVLAVHGAQWFSSGRNDELERLLTDVHKVLVGEPAITDIAWHEESDMGKPAPAGYPTPV